MSRIYYFTYETKETFGTFNHICWLNMVARDKDQGRQLNQRISFESLTFTQGLSASIRIVSSACADNLETMEKEGKLWQRFRGRNLWNTRGYSNVHARAASNQGRAWSCGHRSLRSFTFAFRILRATAVTIFPVNRPVRFRVISMDYLNHSERRWLANTSLIRMSDRCQRNTRME